MLHRSCCMEQRVLHGRDTDITLWMKLGFQSRTVCVASQQSKQNFTELSPSVPLVLNNKLSSKLSSCEYSCICRIFLQLVPQKCFKLKRLRVNKGFRTGVHRQIFEQFLSTRKTFFIWTSDDHSKWSKAEIPFSSLFETSDFESND